MQRVPRKGKRTRDIPTSTVKSSSQTSSQQWEYISRWPGTYPYRWFNYWFNLCDTLRSLSSWFYCVLLVYLTLLAPTIPPPFLLCHFLSSKERNPMENSKLNSLSLLNVWLLINECVCSHPLPEASLLPLDYFLFTGMPCLTSIKRDTPNLTATGYANTGWYLLKPFHFLRRRGAEVHGRGGDRGKREGQWSGCK